MIHFKILRVFYSIDAPEELGYTMVAKAKTLEGIGEKAKYVGRHLFDAYGELLIHKTTIFADGVGEMTQLLGEVFMRNGEIQIEWRKKE